MEEAPVPGCILEGFLEKRGGSKGGRKNWQRRFFVVNEDNVSYYTPRGDLKGVIDMSKVIEVKEVELKGRPNCIQISVDSSEDKKAKVDVREIPIDCLNPDTKMKWSKTVDTISKIYKLRKNNTMFSEYQAALSERIYQILNATGAFYLNNFEFLKRLVNQQAKNEWMEVVVPLFEPLFSFLNKISWAARDGTLRTSEDAMENFSPLEKILGTMITRWQRLNDKGHGAEVDKMNACLEALESSVHRLENVVAPFVNDQKSKKLATNNVPQLINPGVAKVLSSVNLVNEPPPNTNIVVIQQQPEVPPEVSIIDEINMSDIDRKFHQQKTQFSNLDVDDPNAAILNALMDLNDLK